jgi:hypothetical protein
VSNKVFVEVENKRKDNNPKEELIYDTEKSFLINSFGRAMINLKKNGTILIHPRKYLDKMTKTGSFFSS